jgi:glycopeptide antibiotics resistance protein
MKKEIPLCLHGRSENFLNSFSFLFILSVMLELSHWLIPNRAFEYYDLFANSLGVAIAYLLINIFSRLKN